MQLHELKVIRKSGRCSATEKKQQEKEVAGIEGTYDLHKYESDCKIWLQKWADHMDSLLEV
jgi:hypothetical protein